MQIVNTNSPSAFGGRISSPKFRENLQNIDEYIGLEDDVDRFKALKLVKMAGKDAGFSAELIELLEYYVIRTDEVDWLEGSQPINYQSVTTTALDLDISERQVRNREKALHALGALTWQDSGNFKRYGMRDRETREIQYAFGVDLSPLASLMPALEAKIASKRAAKLKWNETKRKISAYRARIRALIAEAGHYEDLDEILLCVTQEYEKISFSIRTYHSQSDLDNLVVEHKSLFEALLCGLGEVSGYGDKVSFSQDTSATGETDFRHIQCTNFQTSNELDYSNRSGTSLQEGVAAFSESNIDSTANGDLTEEQESESHKIAETISKITWKQVLSACSERFKERIPLHERALSWNDLTEAAHALLPTLGIHKSAWWEACSTLGRTGATICIMIIDQKLQDPSNPIRSPGGYLREMTARAKKGELNLQGSIFGLLKRNDERNDA
jgi:replication initiation protein RepC